MAQRRASPLTGDDFWTASRGFSLVWVAHLGRRHGLLQALADSRAPMAPRRLARRAEKDGDAVRLWCEAAHALGMLRAANGRYALAPGVQPLLVDERGSTYLGGHLDYLALRSLDFDAFDGLFRDGEPTARRPRYIIQAFEEATKWDHTAFLELLVPKLPALRRKLRQGADVLDLGAGVGAFDFRLAEAFPKCRIVGVEPDRTALRLARGLCARRGLEDQVRFEQGSGEALPFRSRFDIVFLGEILCATDQARAILPRCRRALKPGGTLVVAEGLVDRRAPPHDPGNALVLAMRLEFALQPAHLFDKETLGRLLKAAGFRGTRFIPAGGGFWFGVATRPS